MNKINKFVLICIATIMWVTPVNAENLSTYTSLSVKETINGTKKYVPPFEYGEMKDGLFVRTLEEEAQSIPGGVQNPIFWDEYAKMVEARKMDKLTKEMKELGYVLLWGMPQLPLEGEESESDYKKRLMDVSISGTEQIGYVTFCGTVDETISEPCYIAVNGIEGDYYKEFSLYKENGYVSSMEMPAGDYAIYGGGFKDDYAARFPFSSDMKKFTVVDGAAVLVPFTIGSITDETKIEKEGPDVSVEKVGKVQRKPLNGFGITIITIAAFGAFLLYIKIKIKT